MKKLLILSVLTLALIFLTKLSGDQPAACSLTCPGGSIVACENPPCEVSAYYVDCAGYKLRCWKITE